MDTQAIGVMTFDFKGTHNGALSAALLIIKLISLTCKMFQNDHS